MSVVGCLGLHIGSTSVQFLPGQSGLPDTQTLAGSANISVTVNQVKLKLYKVSPLLRNRTGTRSMLHLQPSSLL